MTNKQMNQLLELLDVFKWVNWVSIDSNGEVWVFNLEPVVTALDFWDSTGESERISKVKPPENWEEEIYEYK